MRTLRTRVLVGYALIVVLLVVGAMITARTQRDHLYGAVDERIERVIAAPRFIEKRIEAGRAGRSAGAGLSDTYLGLVPNVDVEVRTLSAPDDDPGFVPEVSSLFGTPGTRTVAAAAGTTERARAAVAELPDGSFAVVAIPLTSTDRSISRLRTTLLFVVIGVLLVISLLTGWILLLGIRPIRALTTAAGEVAVGKSPDVSAVPTASREASDLKAAINALITTAKTNEEKMRRFVADASHELRTPLTTLRGYASLVNSDSELQPEVVSDSLSRISEESLRMSRLVDDLLALTRSEESDAIELIEFDLVGVIEDIAADLRVVQPDRTISLDLPERGPVTADKGLITQALLAMTTNALRHTPASASLTVSLSVQDGSTRVEVVDTGPGIEATHLPHLFERFYRVTSVGSQAGSGLGLAIVASIIERHGGLVGADSLVGVGSTFWFELPNQPRST